METREHEDNGKLCKLFHLINNEDQPKWKNLSYLNSKVELDAAAVLHIERDQEVETLRRPSNCTCSSIDPICIGYLVT